jgi:hypothetical protein
MYVSSEHNFLRSAKVMNLVLAAVRWLLLLLLLLFLLSIIMLQMEGFPTRAIMETMGSIIIL